jgi:hypothetical protein
LTSFFVEGELINELAMGRCWGGAKVEDPDDLTQLARICALTRVVTYSNHREQDMAGGSSFHGALGLVNQ